MEAPSPARRWWAVVRLHAAGGARAALRSGAVGVAVVIMAFGSAPDPAWTLRQFVIGVLAPAVPDGSLAPPQARLLLAAIALGFARLGARRAGAGATGWMASLPLDGRTARLGAWAAACLAALPVAVFLLLAFVAVAMLRGTRHALPLSPSALATLPLLLGAAGAAALSVRPRAATAVAALALLASAWGTWPALIGAALLLAAWDAVAGPLAGPTARSVRGGRLTSRGAGPAAGRAAATRLAVRWAWRATGPRAVLDGLAAAVIPIGFAAFGLRNNPDLAPAMAATVARLGAGLGVVAIVATMAGTLLARRAPWPWPRSLPWSARERVLVDVVATGAPSLAVLVAAPFFLGAPSVTATLATVAVAAPAAASALRVGARRQTGAVGESAMIGVATAALVAWFPWMALAAPLAGWLLVVRGARRERREAEAVRWSELRHDLGGDMGWISRT